MLPCTPPRQAQTGRCGDPSSVRQGPKLPLPRTCRTVFSSFPSSIYILFHGGRKPCRSYFCSAYRTWIIFTRLCRLYKEASSGDWRHQLGLCHAHQHVGAVPQIMLAMIALSRVSSGAHQPVPERGIISDLLPRHGCLPRNH